MSTTSSYDTVVYPSATFPQTHPDRLALIARLHGLAAPDVATARVLEIGGGDGFNLIALATAFPRASFRSFDLSAEAVARGQQLVAASGLANVRVEQGDILEWAETVEAGGFDYIIAHGVYAWVPAPVRDAIWRLVARALAPDGVFFVSYNAMPGGHVRQVMRDMLLLELQGIEEIGARMAAARAFLEGFRQPRPDDDAVVTAMRAQAVAMLGRPDAVLFHDELGECFAPQYLSDVAAMAEAHGLEFLDDSGRNRLGDGFVADETSDQSTSAIVAQAQRGDFAAMRFFRQNLFVRAGRGPRRQPRFDTLAACHAAGQFAPDEDGGIKVGDVSFALADHELSDWLLNLGAGWPRHRPLAEIGGVVDRDEALYRLFAMGLLHLSTVPAPFVLEPPVRPRASALARAQIAQGLPEVTTLHFETMKLPDPAARGLIALLDGTRDTRSLAAAWRDLPHSLDLTLGRALDLIARQRFLSGTHDGRP